MEDYVVPEFYDVLVGGGTGTSGPGGHGATGGNNYIDWDLETGMTGRGWEFSGPNIETGEDGVVQIPNGSYEETKTFIQPYVDELSFYLKRAFPGCVNK